MDIIKQFHDIFPQVNLVVVIAIWFLTGVVKKCLKVLGLTDKGYDIACYSSPVLLGILWGIVTHQGIVQGIIIGGFAGFTYQIAKPLIKRFTKDKEVDILK